MNLKTYSQDIPIQQSKIDRTNYLDQPAMVCNYNVTQ